MRDRGESSAAEVVSRWAGIDIVVSCAGNAAVGDVVARLLAQADDPAAERAALNARQPHGRLVSASEVAQAILYLASPANGSTNGATLAVDGGLDNLAPSKRD